MIFNDFYIETDARPNKMWFEGSKDTKPSIIEIDNAVNKRGFVAIDTKVFFDDMQGFWRFNGKLQPTAV